MSRTTQGDNLNAVFHYDGSESQMPHKQVSWLPARMKKIQAKKKAVECYEDYTLIFSDTQGQLTPHSVLESGGNSNSFKLLWL